MFKLKLLRLFNCKQATNLRLISILSGKCNKSDVENARFTAIYKFPYIRIFSLVNRLKFYQTFLTIGGIPASVALNQLNLIDSEVISATAILGISGCIVLHTAGYLTNKFIGFIYVNEADASQVKISYGDFWGRRKDAVLQIEDIVPFSDLPTNRLTDGLYLNVQLYSHQQKNPLRINLKFGHVLDADRFKQIFLHKNV